jgi:hypothetical protein
MTQPLGILLNGIAGFPNQLSLHACGSTLPALSFARSPRKFFSRPLRRCQDPGFLFFYSLPEKHPAFYLFSAGIAPRKIV